MIIATEIQILDPINGERVAYITYDRATWQGEKGPWRNVPFNPHPSESDPLRNYADHLIGLGYSVLLVTGDPESETDGGEARVY